MVLRKFTKLEYIDDILNYGIYASPLRDLNDPYEYHNIDDEENYRIISLSKAGNSAYMLGHYADGGKGCIIEYNKPADAYEIEYIKSQELRRTLAESMPDRALLKKSTKWSIEREWRIIYSADRAGSEFEIHDGKVFYRAQPKRIILGSEVDKNTEGLNNLAAAVANGRQIKIAKLKKSETRFAFEYDRDFSFAEFMETLNS